MNSNGAFAAVAKVIAETLKFHSRATPKEPGNLSELIRAASFELASPGQKRLRLLPDLLLKRPAPLNRNLVAGLLPNFCSGCCQSHIIQGEVDLWRNALTQYLETSSIWLHA
jgi:hypothetical protein